MPQDAWRDLIRYLMAKHGIKHKSQLATAIGTCDRTVRRWLGEKPAVPEEGSLEKVAAWAGMPVEELLRLWTLFMVKLNNPYQSDLEVVSEIREEAGLYDGQHNPLTEARSLLSLELRNVPPEMAPPLHQRRVNLVDEVEKTIAGIREKIADYRDLYKSAVATAMRTQLPQV